MNKQFVGRERELQLLHQLYESGRSEFVAVYGRRRVGKTYLIQHFFRNTFAFEAIGVLDGTKEEQMFSFTSSLIKAGYSGPAPKTWLEAFGMLSNTLESRSSAEHQVIYIDELPCFDTPKSGFVRALGYFWNSWASTRDNVILIVCGSSTSWMIDNIINNHGGLHNRITRSIYLRQFTLHETEEYLRSIGIRWSRQLVVETYMMFGGVPYYLSLLDKQEGLAQNIDRLYFMKNSVLSTEYHRLYASLFRSPESYLRIIETLAHHKAGMTRKEIVQSLKTVSSGTMTNALENLVNCDIIRRFHSKSNGKIKTNDAYYQLTDLFTLFHLNFSKTLTTESYWQQNFNMPAINTWRGLAFENVCLAHISQISHALGLDRIALQFYSWRGHEEPRPQVDLIIERADRLIHLCEIKYSSKPYTISKQEDMKMFRRQIAFEAESKTKCGILPTWITLYGLTQNEYSSEVQYQVTLDDLFMP